MSNIFRDSDNYFTVLGLPKGASESAVKTAYFRMAKLFHPDKNPPPGFEEQMTKIIEAYKLLKDYREYIDWYGADHGIVYEYINEQKIALKNQERAQQVELERRQAEEEY